MRRNGPSLIPRILQSLAYLGIIGFAMCSGYAQRLSVEWIEAACARIREPVAMDQEQLLVHLESFAEAMARTRGAWTGIVFIATLGIVALWWRQSFASRSIVTEESGNGLPVGPRPDSTGAGSAADGESADLSSGEAGLGERATRASRILRKQPDESGSWRLWPLATKRISWREPVALARARAARSGNRVRWGVVAPLLLGVLGVFMGMEALLGRLSGIHAGGVFLVVGSFGLCATWALETGSRALAPRWMQVAVTNRGIMSYSWVLGPKAETAVPNDRIHACEIRARQTGCGRCITMGVRVADGNDIEYGIPSEAIVPEIVAALSRVGVDAVHVDASLSMATPRSPDDPDVSSGSSIPR